MIDLYKLWPRMAREGKIAFQPKPDPTETCKQVHMPPGKAALYLRNGSHLRSLDDLPAVPKRKRYLTRRGKKAS